MREKNDFHEDQKILHFERKREGHRKIEERERERKRKERERERQ